MLEFRTGMAYSFALGAKGGCMLAPRRQLSDETSKHETRALKEASARKVAVA